MPMLNKDTTVCMSLAGRPSNIGTRFHNFLYDELGLDFVYKAFTTGDIEGAIRGVRALGIRGCSVSMPFKEAVIPLVDELDPSATAIGAVNTIVNEDGRLIASNTDYEAVARLIRQQDIDPALPVLVRGSGGMARAVVAAFRAAAFVELTVLARNATAGHALAERYGYRWTAEEPPPGSAVLVNATPLGMSGAGADVLAFTAGNVRAADVVFDVVALPAETPFILAGRSADKQVITGAEVITLQAALQFERYTGVVPTPEQVARASAFAREQERAASLGPSPR